jgi:hypothetical protein
MKEKTRNWLNRIFSFVIGGLVILIVMNVSVVSNVKKQNEELQKELNKATELLNEAPVLLNDAKAFFENNYYDRAKERLDTLFEKHPGSDEAVEAKKLYAELETALQKEQELQLELDKKWETAVGEVREVWAKTMAAQLRLEFEKNREQLEKDMDEVLNKEWEKMKSQIRKEWEKQE